MSYYDVYLVEDLGAPRNHHAIFVETNQDRSVWLFQVTGDIQNGMRHEDKHASEPSTSATFRDKTLIGKVATANFDRIKGICEGIPAPKKQFNGPKRLFPNEPLRRCQEWTKEAIDALLSEGVLEK
ncbi:Hypothetical predicted protein [Lecanosticta acicola]|uniref:Uncharacterized protein n=1 Tax=Lecanosticta acicola TaxID=111012 RepID=A0AAI8YZR3_9PEZI|nr:Hypothetical predicted protein [Lecanosticta acicola]